MLFLCNAGVITEEPREVPRPSGFSAFESRGSGGGKRGSLQPQAVPASGSSTPSSLLPRSSCYILEAALTSLAPRCPYFSPGPPAPSLLLSRSAPPSPPVTIVGRPLLPASLSPLPHVVLSPHARCVHISRIWRTTPPPKKKQ